MSHAVRARPSGPNRRESRRVRGTRLSSHSTTPRALPCRGRCHVRCRGRGLAPARLGLAARFRTRAAGRRPLRVRPRAPSSPRWIRGLFPAPSLCPSPSPCPCSPPWAAEGLAPRREARPPAPASPRRALSSWAQAGAASGRIDLRREASASYAAPGRRCGVPRGGRQPVERRACGLKAQSRAAQHGPGAAARQAPVRARSAERMTVALSARSRRPAACSAARTWLPRRLWLPSSARRLGRARMFPSCFPLTCRYLVQGMYRHGGRRT